MASFQQTISKWRTSPSPRKMQTSPHEVTRLNQASFPRPRHPPLLRPAEARHADIAARSLCYIHDHIALQHSCLMYISFSVTFSYKQGQAFVSKMRNVGKLFFAPSSSSLRGTASALSSCTYRTVM